LETQSDTVEEKLNGPLRDMLVMERELLNASKKDDVFRSEEMKVETFRMSLVERFCEYMDSYNDFFKRGSLLLNNYQEEVTRTKTASRKQVEEILNMTLEVDAEVAAEVAAQLPPPPIFGSPLEDTIRRDQTDVPRIILHVVAYLDHMALTQMGIFRISGHTGSVQALKEAIDSGHEVDLTLLNNSHVAATLFKLYLRTLPDTLTIHSRFDEWIQVVNGIDITPSSTDRTASPRFPESIIDSLTSLVDSLPLTNSHTLDYLISFCTRVVAHADQNMMGAKNLASLIAPNILNRPESAGIVNPQDMLEDVSQANKIVECMILNYDKIFANVDYHFKSNPVVSLASIASEYPLCADRAVKHGMSLIVDLPPEEMPPSSESPTGSPTTTTIHPKAEELRKRAVKKKTVSSLSLIKDRKLKKKDKNHSDRQTIVVGESDFKVPPTSNSSLRPISPRGHQEHSRTASEVHPNLNNAAGTREFSSSLSDHDSLFRAPSSPPSSFSEEEMRPSLSSSTKSSSSIGVGGAGGLSSPTTTHVHQEQTTPKSLSPATSGTDISTKAPHSSPSKDKEKDKDSKRVRKSSKARRTSETPKPRTSSNPISPIFVTSSSSSQDPPVSPGSPGLTGGGGGGTSFDSPPLTRNRRHSITLASGEGLDPTKENFGSIGPAAAIGVIQTAGASNLNIDALVDDQSGSMRMRANSRRGSVLTNPYSPMAGNSRSGSISSRDRLLTPTKLRFPSPTTATSSLVESSAPISALPSGGLNASKSGFDLLHLGSSASPPPFLPLLKDKKNNKDRTAALSSVKFDNPEDFNKLMDDRFGKGPIASYVVLGYNANGSIRMQAGGEGSVTEMICHLRDDEIQYCLIRISYLEDGHSLTRDVFVQWNGPKVSAIQKGIKKAHCGEVKNALCPTAIEILASSKSNFTLDTLVARSAPTATRIID
jgi:hypothetical protein